MSKYLKNTILTLLVLVLILAGFMVKTFYDAGEFREIKPHFKGQSKSISGVLSSEDITIHPRTGLAFISSADRRARWSDAAQPRQGAIYGFDLSSANSQLVNLTAGFDKEFNPHGIGLWMAGDGTSSLFVVNHRRDGHFVEIFDYRGGKLVHRQSVSGALMHSPNDVLPVGPAAFYVTNDHGNATAFGRMAEEYLQLARSYVLYYDGKGFRKVAQALAYANGINISSDGQTVYVAATVAQKIYVYDRDRNTDLWVGSHPKLLTFVKHSKDPKVLSPSQVIKVTIKESGQHTVKEIYLNNGQPLSGSSVAAVFENTLLIGSVFEEHFLLCNLQN
jgi:arylesterase/paraoxonase